MSQTHSVSIVHDTRSVKRDGTCPLKLLLVIDSEPRRYKLDTNPSLSVEDYAIVSGRTGGSARHKVLRKLIADELARATTIIGKLTADNTRLAFNTFRHVWETGELPDVPILETLARQPIDEGFVPTLVIEDNVVVALRQIATHIEQQDRTSTAAGYRSTANSIERLMDPRRRLSFRDITPLWLRAYEKAMLQRGGQQTKDEAGNIQDGKGQRLAGVGIYMRNLRAATNIARQQGLVTEATYPFGKGRYAIPKGRGEKIALSIAEIRLIAAFSPLSDHDARLRDLWLFSYLCKGMNVKDILLLHYRDFRAESFTFRREKTKRTAAEPPIIYVPITDDIRTILDRWGNPDRSPGSVVFQLGVKDVSVEKNVRYLSLRIVKQINKTMKGIVQSLGINKAVKTYEARNSFATNTMTMPGASVAYLQQALGHTTMSQTGVYVKEMEEDQQRHLSESLL